MTEFRETAQAGSTLFVMGLVGREKDGSPAVDIARQTTNSLDRLESLLSTRHLTLVDIARLRIYLTDIGNWRDRVLSLVDSRFTGSLPPCTVVGVSALVEPWMLIEIEVEAVVSTNP